MAPSSPLFRRVLPAGAVAPRRAELFNLISVANTSQLHHALTRSIDHATRYALQSGCDRRWVSAQRSGLARPTRCERAQVPAW